MHTYTDQTGRIDIILHADDILEVFMFGIWFTKKEEQRMLHSNFSFYNLLSNTVKLLSMRPEILH